MQREPIEFGVINEPKRALHTARFAATIHNAERATRDLPAMAAIDDAFAEFSRIDLPATHVDASIARPKVTKAIVANIAAQLNMLDRQRDELAALLSTVRMSQLTD